VNAQLLTDGYANVDVTVGKSHEWLSSVSECEVQSGDHLTLHACHAGFRRPNCRRHSIHSGGSKVPCSVLSSLPRATLIGRPP